MSVVASRLDHVAMISDEPLHVTCVGAWKGSGLFLLDLLLLTQIALLISAATTPLSGLGFKTKKPQLAEC